MIKRVASRVVRALLSTAAAGTLAKWQNDPRYIWLVPVLQGAGKAIRDRWPKAAPWLPF